MSPNFESRGGTACSEQREILVVEDEFLIRYMLSDELREAGFKVIEACDAIEALALLQTLTPDLIISDVRMPGPLDGLALLAKIRETKPELPVIIISGHLHPSQALIEGATRFVSKPFIMKVVVEAARNALGTTL